MKALKIFGLALGVVALIAAAQPAQAACGAPFLITSINSDTGYIAYVVNETVTPETALDGSSITADITGFFWGLGVGDPALGVGADNGGWSTLNWLYVYPGYAASVLTTWAADPSIDTCIDAMGPLGQRCQVTFFQDVDTGDGSGLFALVSTPDNPASGDFFLDNGGVNITLAPQEGMAILGSSRAGDTGVVMELSGPSADGIIAGSYLSDSMNCQGAGAGGTDPLNGLIIGYRAVTQVMPRGSAPPSDFNAAAWDDAGGGVQALGNPSIVSIGCDGDSDVYASYQLILDSGFASPIVSATTTRAECGPNIADPQGIRVKPEGRQAPRTRSR